MYFISLSNEEKFVLADMAACKAEQLLGRRMSPAEYENFVWDFIQDLYKPKYDQSEQLINFSPCLKF